MKNFLYDTFYDILGGLLFAIGTVCFFNSSNIAPGGASGVGIVLNYIFGAPIGLSVILINIPIIAAGFYYLGKDMMKKTLKSVLLVSMITDLAVVPYFPVYKNDRLLAALFGGLFSGAGLSMVFLHGSTTGGTDILSHIIKIKYPSFSMGKAIMLIDCVVILVSSFVFKNAESAMYALVALFCTSKIIDAFLYGAERGAFVFIVSENCDKISERIIKEMDRGATELKAVGAYSGAETGVLICVIRHREFSHLKKIVSESDKKAFFTVCTAEEILGEGFGKAR